LISITASLFILIPVLHCPLLFFIIDPPTTDIYTLSLHDALPIFGIDGDHADTFAGALLHHISDTSTVDHHEGVIDIIGKLLNARSEEHTSELQSRENLVCRLLLEKKKNTKKHRNERKTQRKIHNK